MLGRLARLASRFESWNHLLCSALQGDPERQSVSNQRHQQNCRLWLSTNRLRDTKAEECEQQAASARGRLLHFCAVKFLIQKSLKLCQRHTPMTVPHSVCRSHRPDSRAIRPSNHRVDQRGIRTKVALYFSTIEEFKADPQWPPHLAASFSLRLSPAAIIAFF